MSASKWSMLDSLVHRCLQSFALDLPPPLSWIKNDRKDAFSNLQLISISDASATCSSSSRSNGHWLLARLRIRRNSYRGANRTFGSSMDVVGSNGGCRTGFSESNEGSCDDMSGVPMLIDPLFLFPRSKHTSRALPLRLQRLHRSPF